MPRCRDVFRRHEIETGFSFAIIAVIRSIGAIIAFYTVMCVGILAVLYWDGVNFQLKQPAENVVSVEIGCVEFNEDVMVFHSLIQLSEEEIPVFLEEAEAVQYNFTILGGHSIYDCDPDETVFKITFADGARHYLHAGGSAYVSKKGRFSEREEATWLNGYDALVEKYKHDLPPNSSYQQEE